MSYNGLKKGLVSTKNLQETKQKQIKSAIYRKNSLRNYVMLSKEMKHVENVITITERSDPESVRADSMFR